MKTRVQDFMFLCSSVFLSKKLSDFDFAVEGVDEFLVVRDGYDGGVGEGFEVVDDEVYRLSIEGRGRFVKQ